MNSSTFHCFHVQLPPSHEKLLVKMRSSWKRQRRAGELVYRHADTGRSRKQNISEKLHLFTSEKCTWREEHLLLRYAESSHICIYEKSFHIFIWRVIPYMYTLHVCIWSFVQINGASKLCERYVWSDAYEEGPFGATIYKAFRKSEGPLQWPLSFRPLPLSFPSSLLLLPRSTSSPLLSNRSSASTLYIYTCAFVARCATIYERLASFIDMLLREIVSGLANASERNVPEGVKAFPAKTKRRCATNRRFSISLARAYLQTIESHRSVKITLRLSQRCIFDTYLRTIRMYLLRDHSYYNRNKRKT